MVTSHTDRQTVRNQPSLAHLIRPYLLGAPHPPATPLPSLYHHIYVSFYQNPRHSTQCKHTENLISPRNHHPPPPLHPPSQSIEHALNDKPSFHPTLNLLLVVVRAVLVFLLNCKKLTFSKVTLLVHISI